MKLPIPGDLRVRRKHQWVDLGYFKQVALAHHAWLRPSLFHDLADELRAQPKSQIEYMGQLDSTTSGSPFTYGTSTRSL